MVDFSRVLQAEPRHDWTAAEIKEIYQLPLTTLMRFAGAVHSKHFAEDEVQMCTLLSVKTGGCKEDCAYCPQSAHYKTDVKAERLLDVDTILDQAKQAKASGSTRFCMGAAWTSPPKKGEQFEQVLAAVRGVKSLGLEVCTTLGMLDEEQAQQLADAGVYAYNHNLDTSPEYYKEIITTRTYQERLDTLANVRKAGMTVCCGGIVGMGESEDDRIAMIQQLTSLDPHPESVPVNLLVSVAGTPLAEKLGDNQEQERDKDIFTMVRTIATARILMPRSRVRLSAGRENMSDAAQALCFLAGANSIFTGDKLLTTANPGADKDQMLLTAMGLKAVGEKQKSEAAVPTDATEGGMSWREAAPSGNHNYVH